MLMQLLIICGCFLRYPFTPSVCKHGVLENCSEAGAAAETFRASINNLFLRRFCAGL
ncbi:hypothetical protein M758_7G089200 [Ceratodon purpureus]|uniref:Uncharacterized protein n=1 Tax=Ceratodon purpureus TaxID=3225 RepID=A0A8T0H9Q1_CERPU|nr:hypothetical protein KC19_7G096600 [Ceratodon purpureus]KAG0610762.1 hypothetical protein M758_7G089200 [Ceratodon purpureus]